MAQTMLTTKDNPFDPFDEVDEWRRFDIENGYNTEALIARLCKTSDELGEEQFDADWNQAIDDILKYCDYGIYEKITR